LGFKQKKLHFYRTYKRSTDIKESVYSPKKKNYHFFIYILEHKY